MEKISSEKTVKMFLSSSNRFETLGKILNELPKFDFLNKTGILLNIDLSKNYRFCIRRFWGKNRIEYSYNKSFSIFDDGLKATFRRLQFYNISFDLITWNRKQQIFSNGGMK